MSSPQVLGPYLTLLVFLIAAFVLVGREFRTARPLDMALPLGRVCLAIPVAVFGADHLTQASSIMKGVPAWMPGKLFWTYFVGIALIAAGLSFLTRVWLPLAAALLGAMMLCFFVMMDIPATIHAPHNRFTWTLAARQSVFGAGAIVLAIAGRARKRTPTANRVATAALYWIAAVTIFYGIEGILHPDRAPAVPLGKVTPLWIPLAHFWTVLTGIAMAIGGVAMFVRTLSRPVAAALGAWIVLLVLTLYLAIMIAQLDVEGINYFCDTLMFGGVLLLASCAHEPPRKVRIA